MYTDDLIGRLRGQPNEPEYLPCSDPGLGDHCYGHCISFEEEMCWHVQRLGFDPVPRVRAICATCRPERWTPPRPCPSLVGNPGGSGEADGILTESQTMPDRPSVDEWAFGIAEAVSRRATCPRASIGVVLLDAANHIVATGYNGSVSGAKHCTEDGCMLYGGHCVRTIHAEQNAVRAAQTMLARYVYGPTVTTAHVLTVSLSSLDIQPYVYGPREVCSHCASVLFRAGITKEPKTRWPS